MSPQTVSPSLGRRAAPTRQGDSDAMAGADIFVGLSAPGVATAEMVRTMNRDAVVFAILIVVLLVKPAGIMGKNVGEKV